MIRRPARESRVPNAPKPANNMIHAVIICRVYTLFRACDHKYLLIALPVNTSGVPRFTKFYTPLHQSSHTLVQKIFSLISSRPAHLCNFLDAPELEEFLGPDTDADERLRVVYRNYATLYFIFVVDGAESELGILDLIQVRRSISAVDVTEIFRVAHKVFVESLDRAFENVCELDLVFHFDEARDSSSPPSQMPIR